MLVEVKSELLDKIKTAIAFRKEFLFDVRSQARKDSQSQNPCDALWDSISLTMIAYAITRKRERKREKGGRGHVTILI